MSSSSLVAQPKEVQKKSFFNKFFSEQVDRYIIIYVENFKDADADAERRGEEGGKAFMLGNVFCDLYFFFVL